MTKKRVKQEKNVQGNEREEGEIKGRAQRAGEEIYGEVTERGESSDRKKTE